MTLTVIWPLYELLDVKDEVVVHAGGFVDWDDVIATRLETVVRGQVLELTDDQVHGLVSEREYNLMHREGRWSLNPGYVFPMRGLVLECKHWNNATLLDIHVIGQAPCDIGNALDVQAALPLPSFWADVEIKDQWRKLCPNSHRQGDTQTAPGNGHAGGHRGQKGCSYPLWQASLP